MRIIICFIISLIILILYIVYLYNRFIYLKNMMKEGWSGIDVQLKRRYDLVLNLVKIVQSYMRYEEGTLVKVIEARKSAMKQTMPDKNKSDMENRFVSGINSLFALAENYPELKSNEQFRELSQTLVEIEDNLQKARRYYNATVRNYNIAVQSFPSNLMASCLKLEPETFFEIDAFEANPIQIKDIL